MRPVDENALKLESAYQMLEVHGIPRTRAKSVANGIDVLATRFRREISSLEDRILRLEATIGGPSMKWGPKPNQNHCEPGDHCPTPTQCRGSGDCLRNRNPPDFYHTTRIEGGTDD